MTHSEIPSYLILQDGVYGSHVFVYGYSTVQAERIAEALDILKQQVADGVSRKYFNADDVSYYSGEVTYSPDGPSSEAAHKIGWTTGDASKYMLIDVTLI